MKIAHVCEYYFPAVGGVNQVVYELGKRQKKAGHDVHVFCSDFDKDKRIKKKEEIRDDLKVHRLWYWFKTGPFALIWPSIFFRLLKEKPDVVHSHEFGHLHFVLAAFAAKLIGAKHIHTTHCPWTDANRSKLIRLAMYTSYNIFSRIALRFTDKVIAITPWEVDFIKKYGGTDEQIVVLPNGMDGDFFKKVKGNDFKKKNGIKNKMVLFFGRMSITKGPEHFVDIAKMILKRRKDVTFFMRGPDEGMMAEVKRRIGNEKRIILKDALRDRKETIKMYQAADVMVLPSFREGLPLTLFEGMAAGLPIVASPVNGIPYEMKEPENGFLVKYGDDKKFAERIEEFLDNKKLSEKVGKANLKKAANYKWDDIARKTLSIYKK